ncbi:hypothetical protein LJB98_03965 [Bacteroidales bacterium OttesenSCG-928-M11]|nr:hypothetical protein [Bacteroidales bacterium OttesenSCG-928-M11]
MGKTPLKWDETTYGFASPEPFVQRGSTSFASGPGYKLNAAKGGYWSEYGFPQAINGGITGGDGYPADAMGFGWSTSANVFDRTYVNSSGSTLGNMLYVDASEFPGIFATLDINESVCPGTVLYCSAWVVNLNTSSAGEANFNEVSYVRPNLVFVLKNMGDGSGEGEVVKRFYTGDIGYGAVGEWRQVAFKFEIPAELVNSSQDDKVNFRLEIQNNGLGTMGNDFALDNISISRSNPTVIATRMNAAYCAPDGSVIEEESLDMEVEVDLGKLNIGKGESQHVLYYRMLDYNLTTFPGDYKGFDYKEGESASCNYDDCEDPGLSGGIGNGIDIPTDDSSGGVFIVYPMYPNMQLYKQEGVGDTDGYYYFGQIDLNKFTNDGGETDEDTKELIYRWSYITAAEVKKEFTLIGTKLTFYQDIPFSILYGKDEDGKPLWNHGQYYIYVAEASGSLLNGSCSGEAIFDVGFDDTDFTVAVSADSEGMAPGGLSVCTNQTVYVKAFSKDVNNDAPLFAYYDWYFGPKDTYPESSQTYTYTVLQTKKPSADSPAFYSTNGTTFDILYFEAESGDAAGYYRVELIDEEYVKTNPHTPIPETDLSHQERKVVSEDGFENWVTNDDRNDLPEGQLNGQDWYNTDEGKAWAYSPVNYIGLNQRGGYISYRKDIAIADYDGVTQATKLDHDDYNSYETRIIEWRLIKEDLKAYRYFFPYDSELPAGDIFYIPIDPLKIEDESSSYEYDYTTGKIYLKGEVGTASPIDPNNQSLDTYRFDSDANYGTYKDINGDPQIRTGLSGIQDGQSPYYIDLRYTDTYSSGEEELTACVDLNRLLSRLRYAIKSKILYLHTNNLPLSVHTLAPYYVSAIPLNIATYDITGVNWETSTEICTNPAEVKLEAEAWGPDANFGEVGYLGTEAMPYSSIIDDDYTYTVRIPEKDFKGNLTTTQFVSPLRFFDEVKRARVKLVSVINDNGTTVFEKTKISEAPEIQESYIGLIDPKSPNKLLTDFMVWIDYQYNPVAANGRSVLLDSPIQMNLRWLLNDRSGMSALESYPLIINAYNYYFDVSLDEGVEISLSEEGDILPIGARLGRVGNDELSGYEEGDNIISNNSLALEILASGLPTDYTREVTGENGTEIHFIPGYEYHFVMEGTGDEEWGASTTCDMTFDFRLKVVPDTIYWKGAENNDVEWNKDDNWYFPNGDGTPSNIKTFAPLPQTNVVIPGQIGQYSTLRDGKTLPETVEVSIVGGGTENKPTGWNTKRKMITFDWENERLLSDYKANKYIEFDYNFRANAANEIYFKMGGELARQDLLFYQKAKVDLKINTIQWYGISAPLKNLYAGDYMFEQANPLSEIRYYNTGSSPQIAPKVNGTGLTNWAEPVNTTIFELEAGEGYALSVGSLYFTNLPEEGFASFGDYGTAISTNGETAEWATAEFTFPQTTTTFNFYHEILKRPMEYTETIENEDGRKYRHRFVYETPSEAKAGNTDEYGHEIISVVPENDPIVSIPVKINEEETRGDSNEPYMVIGNPFMSHMDFETFYKENYGLIEPGYKILQGTVTGEETYLSIMGTDANSDGVFDELVSTNDNLTLRSIPPMQTFLVTLKGGVTRASNITINRCMGVVDEDDSPLQAPARISNMLRLSVRDHNKTMTSAVVKVSEGAFDEYNPSEDSRLVLIEDVTSVSHIFTIVDRNYLDINRLGEVPSSIPIGVLYGSKGKSTISISGLDTFAGYVFYFVDTDKKLKIPLEDDAFEYEFDYDGNESIGRFYLVTEDATQINELQSDLSVYSQHGMINVLSLDGSLITEVSIYNVEGHLLYKSVDTGKSRLSIPQPGQSPVMIVKASTSTTSTVTKIINK